MFPCSRRSSKAKFPATSKGPKTYSRLLFSGSLSICLWIREFAACWGTLWARKGSVRTGGSEEIVRGAAVSRPTMAGSGGEEDRVEGRGPLSVVASACIQ